jgi:hypothetical protein
MFVYVAEHNTMLLLAKDFMTHDVCIDCTHLDSSGHRLIVNNQSANKLPNNC